jgi:hypothetical protein
MRRNITRMNWDARETAILRALAPLVCAAEIARFFGVSRSTVSSRANYLGIPVLNQRDGTLKQPVIVQRTPQKIGIYELTYLRCRHRELDAGINSLFCGNSTSKNGLCAWHHRMHEDAA